MNEKSILISPNENLIDLANRCGCNDLKSFFNTCFLIADWMVEQKEKGRYVGSWDENSKNVLYHPMLEKISSNYSESELEDFNFFD